MILADHSAPIGPDWRSRIYPIGDLHITLKSFDYQGFKEYVQLIKSDPYGVAIVMGDISDARDRRHRYYDPEAISNRYRIDEVDILEDRVLEDALELLSPIAGQLLGMLRGNHHMAGFTRRLTRQLSAAAGREVPDLGDRAMIRIKWGVGRPGRPQGEFTTVIFAAHRDSGSRKPGAQLNNQLDVLVSYEADVYLFAHSHRVTSYVQPRAYLAPRGSLTPIVRQRLMLNAGAWQRPLWDRNSYVDEKNLPMQAARKLVVEMRREHQATRPGAKRYVYTPYAVDLGVVQERLKNEKTTAAD